MQVHKHLATFPRQQQSVLTIGTFDGLQSKKDNIQWVDKQKLMI